MSNRRLMGALSILLVAVLFMVMGCGDGKRRKETIRSHGKAFAMGNAKDRAAKLKAAQSIEANMNSLTSESAGQKIDRNSMEGGVYSLTSITTFVKAQSGAEDAWASITNPVANGELQAGTNAQSAGLLSSALDSGRVIEIPMEFTVDSQTGRFVTPSQMKSRTLKSTMDLGSGEIHQEFTSDKAGLSLMSTLLSKDGNAEKKYVSSIDGREVDAEIRKNETGLRIVVRVTEAQAQATADKGDLTLSRTMIFDYTLDPATKNQPPVNTNPTTSPAAPASAPAQPILAE